LLIAKRFASRIDEVIDREWSGIGTILPCDRSYFCRPAAEARLGHF
jgi:hypothetical protein